jgi:tetratricopeptide (TPR) repeat protein
LIDKDDICPPKEIPGSVPPSESSLEEIIAEDKNNFAAVFALGYVQLRAGQLEDAIASFRKACSIDSSSAEAHYNLGVSLFRAEQGEEAVRELRKAVLKKKDFAQGYYSLGKVLEAMGDKEGAVGNYRKSLRVNPQQAPVLMRLAPLLNGDDAFDSYKLAYKIDPSLESARDLLAKLEVDNGARLFDDGKFQEAFSVWGLAYREYPRSFSAHQVIVEEIRHRVRDLSSAGGRQKAINSYWKSFESAPERKEELVYELICTGLFSIGLLPELWLARNELAEKLAYWKTQSFNEDVVPYAVYRHGVVLAYLGDFEESKRELERARDHMPPSKHEGIKIAELIELVKELVALHKSKGDSISPDESSDQEWSIHGFDDAFQIKAWRAIGVKPAVAQAWREAGFSPQQAGKWLEAKIEVAPAKQWKEHKFENPLEVRKWIRSDVSPVEAVRWKKSFPDGPQVPIQCIQAGFRDPELAARWMKLFTFPSEAIRWIELDFSPQDAAVWLRQGVSDPFEAKRQIEGRPLDLGDD